MSIFNETFIAIFSFVGFLFGETVLYLSFSLEFCKMSLEVSTFFFLLENS